MKARRTSWVVMVCALGIGVALGWAFARFIGLTNLPLLGTTYAASGIMFLLGLALLIMGLTVKRYVKGRLKYLDPGRAFFTLASAKAMCVGGFFLAGWFSGQIINIASKSEASFFKHALITCAVAAFISLLDGICGIIVEKWCQLPPPDGKKSEKKSPQAADSGAQAA
ncbi:MAG: DUF3180 domain-containing protein [Bifidobacteriaceae bacterium]|nr:DUF3180 domain-containing protein [Bifidobacteriaceae bacterium]